MYKKSIFFLNFFKSPKRKKAKKMNVKIWVVLIFFIIKLIKPIVQLVEQAAHNGFVVGSNPTKLKIVLNNYFNEIQNQKI